MSGFRHEALLYREVDGFVRAVLPFVTAGLDRGEPVLVAVSSRKAQAVRDSLPPRVRDAPELTLVDMAAAGRNPARSVSVWSEFTREPGHPRRGVAELLWPGRTADEIVECQHSERVLNVALADAPLRLVCAYDGDGLAAGDVTDAAHHHIGMATSIADRPVHELPDRPVPAVHFPESPLTELRAPASIDYHFGGGDLQQIRDYVAGEASACLDEPSQAQDLVLAVNEVASNSIRHGGGHGHLRTWRTDRSVICEITDAGFLDQPLAGLRRPKATADGGAGMWLVHQVCDLVQVRSSERSGTVVRLTMNRDREGIRPV